jgi:hypothetical protein
MMVCVPPELIARAKPSECGLLMMLYKNRHTENKPRKLDESDAVNESKAALQHFHRFPRMAHSVCHKCSFYIEAERHS